MVIVVGLLMAGLTLFAIRSALQPLRRIESGLSEREPRDLTPLEVGVPSEIRQLVGAINRFMARQARQFEIMGNLIADASHQLRTPIAALRAQADLVAEEPDRERQLAMVARIHDRSVSLSRLTDQLLSHAMIIHRADAAPREVIDLRTVALRTVEESDHDLLAGPDDMLLDLPEDHVWCRGDALSLVEACKNLVIQRLSSRGSPGDGCGPSGAARNGPRCSGGLRLGLAGGALAGCRSSLRPAVRRFTDRARASGSPSSKRWPRRTKANFVSRAPRLAGSRPPFWYRSL